MARRKPWAQWKAESAESTVWERDVGYLDEGMGPVLEALNSLKGVATTSSCIGRITLVEGEVHWGREDDSRIAYKTHGRITPETVLRVVSRGYRDLWLKATGPIIHARTGSLECALHLLGKARENGFKHSGVISHGGPGGTVVELMSASQMAVPLVAGGVALIRLDLEALKVLADKANATVAEGRARLTGLLDSLLADQGPCG